MKNILIILLFIISNTYGNQEKIEIRNFGIICIGSGYDYIGKHNWELSFLINDSLYKFSIILYFKIFIFFIFLFIFSFIINNILILISLIH